jgi:predicted ATPase/DNA-binding winged helix-turn-helix (wHTH) protein
MDLDAAFRFSRFTLFPARRQLLLDGAPVALGARAFDLLHVLAVRRDRTVTKSELLDLVWPDVVVEEGNLHVQVSALRKILGERVIVTVPGRGYRFVAPLSEEPTVALQPKAAQASPAPRLPPQPSPLIGRDDVLPILVASVSGHPLVTITGAAGIGKTHLALAVAGAVAERWPDGVAWVEGAALHESGQLVQAVAQSLGITLQGACSAEQLATALQSRSMLLLLDNCEHLLDAATALVAAMRRIAPTVHLLLTSQQALRVSGEQVFQVPPLALPSAIDVPDERFGALRLFAERARATDRQFRLDSTNGVAVADICRELDGLPLAIELAAARVKLLGVQGLRERLGQRLRLLTGGVRDALPRHQTLRAALEWSHGLLNPAEQAVLRRVGVFVGGFTLELAQQVACDLNSSELDEWTVLDALASLVDRSLVSVDAGEPVRYRLLETMRVFALEQLERAGETAAWRTRHARAMADLFAAVDESRWGDEGTASASEATERLRPEIENARAALDWSVQTSDWATAITLAGAGTALYVQLGLGREVLPILRALRPHLDGAPPSAQVNLLWRLGTLGVQDGMPHDELQRIKSEAVAKARAGGFRRRLQTTLAALGFTHARRGDLAAAEHVGAELRALERPSDPAYVRGLRLSVEMMVHEQRDDFEQVVASLGAQRAILYGTPDEAVPLMTCESNLVLYLNVLGRFEEAAVLGASLVARPDLPRTFIFTICSTAYALAALGRLDEALALMRTRRREIAEAPIGVNSAESLAMLCLAGGRLRDAVLIDAAADRQAAGARGKPHPLTRAFRARLQAALSKGNVAADDIDRWRQEGASLSDEGAVDLALR